MLHRNRVDIESNHDVDIEYLGRVTMLDIEYLGRVRKLISISNSTINLLLNKIIAIVKILL